jgi:hypothetical protein
VNDTHALHPMAKEVKDLLQPEEMTTLTDKGYTVADQLNKCQEDGIITYSSPKEFTPQDNGLFNNDIFVYDAEKDQYTCPNGKPLTTNGTVYEKGTHRIKHYKAGTKTCRECPLREGCNRNKNGKIIERNCLQEILDANRERVEADP